jgi:uncharacterized membrane protein
VTRRAALGPIGLAWSKVRDSLWFLPGAGATSGIVFGHLVAMRLSPYLEEHGLGSSAFFAGGAEAARVLLGTIAGSLITVTGVTFSVTIVALQLASSQFTPRLLRRFVADRANQGVLATFIGTFTYTLVVLRTIRSRDEGPGFVPGVAVSLSVVLLFVSVAALIYFIHHAARSMQASTILERETRQALALVDGLFPQETGELTEPPLERPRGEAHVVRSERTGFLQAVYESALDEVAAETSRVIQMEPYIGAKVLVGEPLALVWGRGPVDERIDQRVRSAFALGDERTPEQDLEFYLIEISDIAVKALSPGINDPTTATLAIDSLAEILLTLAVRKQPAPTRATEHDNVYFIARRTTFERALRISLDSVRHFGASTPVIAVKLLGFVARLARLVPKRGHAALAVQRDAILFAARKAIDNPVDVASLERAAADAARALDMGLTRPTGDEL